MNNQVVVYLNAKVSPAGTSWHDGELERQTVEGVWIVNRNGFNNSKVFFPAHQIQRIEYR